MEGDLWPTPFLNLIVFPAVRQDGGWGGREEEGEKKTGIKTQPTVFVVDY